MSCASFLVIVNGLLSKLWNRVHVMASHCQVPFTADPWIRFVIIKVPIAKNPCPSNLNWRIHPGPVWATLLICKKVPHWLLQPIISVNEFRSVQVQIPTRHHFVAFRLWVCWFCPLWSCRSRSFFVMLPSILIEQDQYLFVIVAIIFTILKRTGASLLSVDMVRTWVLLLDQVYGYCVLTCNHINLLELVLPVLVWKYGRKFKQIGAVEMRGSLVWDLMMFYWHRSCLGRLVIKRQLCGELLLKM